VPFSENGDFPTRPLLRIQYVLGGGRPCVGEEPLWWRGLMERCWSGEVGVRPTFGEIVEILEEEGECKRTERGSSCDDDVVLSLRAPLLSK
jgi:hypothetical protein